MTTDKLVELQEAFAYFDYDGNGALDMREATQVIQSMGYNPTWAEMQRKFESADTDHSGTLDFFEFCETMLKGWESGKENETTDTNLLRPFAQSMGKIELPIKKVSEVLRAGGKP